MTGTTASTHENLRFCRPLWSARFAAFAALALTGLAPGCASDPASPGQPAEPASQTAPMNATPDQALATGMSALGYRLVWKGTPRVEKGSPVLHVDLMGDAVAVQDSAYNLTLLEDSSGSMRWSTNLGGRLTRYVGNVRWNDRVVACSDTEATLIDAVSGEVVGRQRFQNLANTKPIIDGEGHIAYGSPSGVATVHSLNTGFRYHAYQMDGAITSPAVLTSGPGAAFVSQSGDVLMLDVRRGTSFGRQRIFGGLSNTPVSDGSTVYAASLDQSVWAIAVDGGSVRWRYRTQSPISAQPVLLGQVLYVTVPGEGLVAIDTGRGEKLWANADSPGLVIGRRGDGVLVWDEAAGVLRSLDAQRGDLIRSIETPDAVRVLTSAPDDGALYVVRRDGATYKFVVR